VTWQSVPFAKNVTIEEANCSFYKELCPNEEFASAQMKLKSK